MTNDMKKMNNTELNQVNGGVDGMVGLYDGEYKTVRVQKNLQTSSTFLHR